jgi:hypothetical protein
MMPLLQRGFLLLIVFGACPGFFAQAPAQTAAASAGQASATAPLMKSPVELFRQLLAMKPEEREKFLADRPADKRAGLLEKIQEYEAMKPEERELSLGATELQSYLEQFVNTAPTNRAAQLAAVPEPYRKIISDRLNVWDILPPDLQKDVLAHEATKRYFLGAGPEALTNDTWKILPPPLQDEVSRLSKVSPEQRRQNFAAAEQFFGLSDEEKQKVLETLSGTERQQVDETLQTLQHLPKEQLDRCLKSIGRLAGLNDRDRREFMKNAGRWNEMPPEERAAWRNLDNSLPPLPPGVEVPTPDDYRIIMPPGMNPTTATNAAP